jgi:hypothetical protein
MTVLASDNTSRIRAQIVPFGSSKLTSRAFEDYFEKLLQQEGCRDAWTGYIDVATATAFPQQLAKGTAPLNGFRHYTLVGHTSFFFLSSSKPDP